MKFTKVLSAVLLLACLGSLAAQVRKGAGTEWQALIKKADDLYHKGEYARALEVGKQALQIAEKNVGPDHPDVATSLENIAYLYRATKREKEAEELEARAARIRSIKR